MEDEGRNEGGGGDEEPTDEGDGGNEDGDGGGAADANEAELVFDESGNATVGSVYPGCVPSPSLTQSFMPLKSDAVARQLSSTRRSAQPWGRLREVLGPGTQACHRASNGDTGYAKLGACTCEPVRVTTFDELVRIKGSADQREACLQVGSTACGYVNGR